MNEQQEKSGAVDAHDAGAVPEQITRTFGVACILLLGWLLITTPPGPAPGSQQIAGRTPQDLPPCLLDRTGYLRGGLYGAIRADIDWRGTDLLCDGMMRPEDSGIRLVFTTADAGGTVLLLGIDEIRPGATGTDFPTNITIIDGASGTFFSTPGKDRCWTTIQSNVQLRGGNWRVEGELYCVSAIPAVSVPGAVTLGDFSFAGRLTGEAG